MSDDAPIRKGWRRADVAGRDETQTTDSATSPSDRSTRKGTFISAGAIFEGTLSLKGDFHIDSEFSGELETDGTITVGPTGAVVGNIRAREIVIRGAVVGNVMAARQLIVEATGKLHGDIETACLEIQKHAFFKGNTSMTQPQSSRRQPSPVTREAVSPSHPGLSRVGAPLS